MGTGWIAFESRHRAAILNVAFSRATVEGLNLEAIDPSDAMKKFVHNMSFKKVLDSRR
ncbi:hypothetical protein ACIQUF_04965 [Pseudomonas sp. NPDC090233]|uniref:hypothetical protein n=1 Tax=Pseudomonas sp. NPDC090233 TaxID=3364479 RepID=UPI00383AD9A0